MASGIENLTAQFGEFSEHDGSSELSCTCIAGYFPVDGKCVDAQTARKVGILSCVATTIITVAGC